MDLLYAVLRETVHGRLLCDGCDLEKQWSEYKTQAPPYLRISPRGMRHHGGQIFWERKSAKVNSVVVPAILTGPPELNGSRILHTQVRSGWRCSLGKRHSMELAHGGQRRMF